MSLSVGHVAGSAKAWMREKEIQALDIRFSDLRGTWRHVTVPIRSVLEGDVLERGVGFDGSSVSGFAAVERSDLRVIPDADTLIMDPFWDQPTAAAIGEVVDAQTHEPYPLDPRGVAARAQGHLEACGIADTAGYSLEPEFYIFQEVSFFDDTLSSGYCLLPEGRGAGGYYAVPPLDRHHNLRQQVASILEEAGFPTKYHHHETGRYGQGEVEVQFAPPVRAADLVMYLKYVVRNVAAAWSRTATFMPKPLAGEPGNGMHVHQKLFRQGRPVFFDPGGYAGLSQEALHYLGGILAHARSLSALTCPTTNSYRRLSAGHEAPLNLTFSRGNRTAAIRIPAYATSGTEKSIEYRVPDPAANPYLVLAGITMAGVWGIKNRFDPEAEGFGPLEENVYRLPEEIRARLGRLPGSLEEALDCLERDHEFLLEGGVFTRDLIDAVLEEGRRRAADLRERPHPYELVTDFDL